MNILASAILVACAVVAYGKNSYMILGPNTIRPGQDYALSVSILSAKAPVDVQATLKRADNVIVTTKAQFIAGKPGELTLKMPERMTQGYYKLDVSGSGGLTFAGSSTISFRDKGFSIFVQTDKGIYKPAETVKFRIFGIKPSLLAVKGELDVVIQDPSGNRVKQLLKQQPNSGVLESSIELSDQPVLGDWKILVTYAGQKTTTTFKVDEYVLPKFEVKVNLPSFITSDDNSIAGNVEAKYTFGKDVEGTVKITATVEPWYSWRAPEQPKIVKSMKINGRADFQLLLSEVKQNLESYLNGKNIKIKAEVTEALTGKTLSGESQKKVHNRAFKLVYPKINPTTFKPGLDFNAVVQVLQQDETPASKKYGSEIALNIEYKWEKKVEKTTTTMTTTSRPMTSTGGPGAPTSQTPITPPPTPTTPCWTWNCWQQPVYQYQRESLKLQADDSGTAVLNLKPPTQAETLSLTLRYTGSSGQQVSLQKTINRMNSPSDSYLQISTDTPTATAGSKLKINLKSTTKMSTVYYQVMSRGSLVQFGSAKLGGVTQGSIQVSVLAEMAPTTRFVVYYITSDGEVVNDALNMNIDGAFKHKVKLSLGKKEAEPGDSISVQVSADPGSYMALSAVDQSTLLLAEANDVTQDKVMAELQKYDTASSTGPVWRGGIMPLGRKRSLWYPWWPTSVGGKDATSVFQQSGVLTFTDTTIYRHVEKNIYPPMIRPWLSIAKTQMGLQGLAGKIDTSVVDPAIGGGTSIKEPTKTRKIFPETWLWSSNIISNGVYNITTTVPDTITSWVASAFAINTQSGLGVVETSSKLRVFRPFFVSLSLPYSVVRGEQVVLQATVFNYMSTDMPVMVTLGASPDLEVSEKQNGKIIGVTNRVAVESSYIAAGKASTVYFPVTALNPGSVTVNIKAQSAFAADAVQKQLLVEPEGAEQEYTESFLLNLKEGESFQEQVPITFPKTVVDGSQRISVTAIGDMMGPATNNLDKLLKMPYGCGEQNMLNFAPNIYVSNYLKTAGLYTDDIKAKATNFMEKGYQRELTYQRNDGSFSAFGQRDPSGSTWLTAFVVKSFDEAREFIYIDQSLVDRAVRWLLRWQGPDGSFSEPGRVIHKAMQGGSGSDATRTAYILLALLQVKDDVSSSLRPLVNTAISKAEQYISSKALASSDIYLMSISHLALVKANSPAATTLRTKVMAQALDVGGVKHWETPSTPEDKKATWRPRHNKAKASYVEVTAYNLLALQETGDLAESISVVNWLTKQMNPNGGFISTQDTVVGLKALSSFASQGKADNMTIDLTSGVETHKFSVTKKNSLVFQSFETKTIPKHINLAASGKGFALVQVTVSYNVMDVPVEPAFVVKSTIISENKQEVLMEVCVRSSGSETGMTVVEHGVLSGFEFDQESVGQPRGLKRMEPKERHVVLYFDSFDSKDTCYKVSLVRTALVAKSQPAIIKVYDYYNPDQQTTVSYESALLKKTDACDVCVNCRKLCN